MKFPYVKFGAKTPEGGEYASFRPVIPIQVRYRGKATRYMALLDSGADVSMFHAEMTEVLGIDLKSGTEMVFYGVGHGKSTGYLHEVGINAGGWWVSCRVAFCPGMIRPDPLDPSRTQGLFYGILGQEGFFEQFNVKFDRSAKQIELNPKQAKV